MQHPRAGVCEPRGGWPPGTSASRLEQPQHPAGGPAPPPGHSPSLCAQNSNVENLPPHIIRLVYKEVTTLTTDPPDGIKVFPNEEDLTDLQVTIEGPGECGNGTGRQGGAHFSVVRQPWLPWERLMSA